MTKPSSLYRMIEKRLDGTLADFVAARQSTHTWKALAAEITLATDIEVSDETIRRWFSEVPEQVAS